MHRSGASNASAGHKRKSLVKIGEVTPPKRPGILGPFQLGKLIGDLATPSPSPRSCMGAPPILFGGVAHHQHAPPWSPQRRTRRALQRARRLEAVAGGEGAQLSALISRAAGGYFPAHLRGTSENRRRVFVKRAAISMFGSGRCELGWQCAPKARIISGGRIHFGEGRVSGEAIDKSTRSIRRGSG